MIKFFSEINPIIAAFIMGLVTFTITSLGAATIFLFKKINQNIMDKLLSLNSMDNMLSRNNTWSTTTLHYRQNRRKTKK